MADIKILDLTKLTRSSSTTAQLGIDKNNPNRLVYVASDGSQIIIGDGGGIDQVYSDSNFTGAGTMGDPLKLSASLNFGSQTIDANDLYLTAVDSFTFETFILGMSFLSTDTVDIQSFGGNISLVAAASLDLQAGVDSTIMTSGGARLDVNADGTLDLASDNGDARLTAFNGLALVRGNTVDLFAEAGDMDLTVNGGDLNAVVSGAIDIQSTGDSITIDADDELILAANNGDVIINVIAGMQINGIGEIATGSEIITYNSGTGAVTYGGFSQVMGSNFVELNQAIAGDSSSTWVNRVLGIGFANRVARIGINRVGGGGGALDCGVRAVGSSLARTFQQDANGYIFLDVLCDNSGAIEIFSDSAQFNFAVVSCC